MAAIAFNLDTIMDNQKNLGFSVLNQYMFRGYTSSIFVKKRRFERIISIVEHRHTML